MSVIQMMAAPVSAFGVHRAITRAMTEREILSRYRGAALGMLWSLLTPLFMLVVYTFAFGYVLKSRWPGAPQGTADFALILFLGLIVHGLLAECLTRAPALIIGNANLVKKVVFPLEVLPWTAVLSATFNALANIVVFCGLYTLMRGLPPVTILLVPLVLAPLLIVSVGVVWLVSAIGVYARDIGQAVGAIATAMLFLSSAIVPVTSLPPRLQLMFMLNPLTFIIDQMREVAYWGRAPNWAGLGVYTVCAVLFAVLACRAFQTMRRGFADVV